MNLVRTLRIGFSKEDWSNNLFAGITYFVLGEKDSGCECVAINIDFDYEKDLSSMIFDCMEKDDLTVDILPMPKDRGF